MDRREAMLRELNVYPLWVRRNRLASVVVDAPVHVSATGDNQVAGNPNPPLSPLVRGEDIRLSSSSPDKGRSGGVAVEPTPLTPTPSPAYGRGELSWPELKLRVRACTACRLRAGCTQTVFGVGDEKADWLFIGEGPGADEDAQGEPFVGQAGQLLDNMLAAIRLKRGNNVYIANVVKCRPPENRNPAADEIAQCLPYLERQIALIRPKLIVALGKVASNALLNRDATLASLRGTLHDYHGIPLVVTYHPAYLLRSPSEKAKAWQDLCLAAEAICKSA